MEVWECAVRECGSVGVWECPSVGVWDCMSVGVWDCGSVCREACHWTALLIRFVRVVLATRRRMEGKFWGKLRGKLRGKL